MNLLIFYVLAGVIIIGLIVFMSWGKIRGKKQTDLPEPMQKEPEQSQSEPVFVRLYDNMRRAIYNETLDGEIVDEIKRNFGSLGRRWNRDGTELYAVTKTVDEEYIPVSQYMKIIRDNPPSLLHGALVQPQTSIAFNVKIQRSMMQKWGPILLFAGAGIFAMVLLIAN